MSAIQEMFGLSPEVGQAIEEMGYETPTPIQQEAIPPMIEGRDIIIAEDILDSGLTLSYLVDMLRGRGPRSVKVCAFSLKDIPNHTPAVAPRYVGAHVPDAFVVGYGLDYAERYRNLPYVGILKPEVYSK